ncbi:hypothetical protein BCV69DRAFT_283634 [Microstroma glucosiphilum]|uniref:Uncharacterized protein n=1 Tax=Pseudomicrostroma glucosiphilum TaxID=1684307 RepID=A0A316U494_9BASI|nr:hypothetical protein BCV69DRAFT_283634 [Pseudomicrostroma glucosiphilum]PWN20099.1 hypothetical protein BCV69DRAFT_283634 [Pseudomicrostroma glucosiphilum]
MAPSIRLSRSRGSTSNLASPANSSPAPAPGDLSRRSSGRAAAARIYQTTQQLARYADEEEDEDDDEDDDEDAEGEEDDEGVGPAATPSRIAGGSRRASSGRAAAARGRGQSSGTTVRLRGRPPGRAAASQSRLPFPQAEEEDEDEDEDEDEEDEEDEPMPEATPSASRSRGRPKGRVSAARGTPRGRGRGARGRPSLSSARKVSDDEEDGDDSRSHAGEEEEERPAFKKRPSRLQGFSLVLDNSQTLLARIPNPDPTADDKGRRGRGGPRGRGRPRKNRSQTTRIIEDSEDEDSDDDRPRPKDPNEVEVDDDHAVPPDEKFKVKLMGKEYILDCDELELPGDEEGDKKIDANGNLLGGRVWKAAPFTSSMRSNPHKVYLLSVDAARTVGFRDSLSLFRSHLRLVKLALLPQEKDDLIAAGRLNAQLRGRNVTIVTAKSVFKQFGAKAIKGGRAVIDDYYEADAKAALEKSGRHEDQGQVVEAEDYRSHAERRRDADRERDRTRRPPDAHTTALYDFHGNLITTTFGDNGAPPFVRSSGWPSRRAAQIRADLSEENWMLEMARNVQGMNAELAENRKERLMKFTDPVEGVSAAYAEEQQRLQEKRKAKMQQQYGQIQQLAPSRLQLLPGELMDVDGVGSASAAGGEDGSATIAPVHPVDLSGQASPTVGDAESAVTPLAPATTDEVGDDDDDHEADRYKDLTNVLAPPVGLYDPTTNLPHFSSSTQPRAARIEKIGKRPLFQSLTGREEEAEKEEEVAMQKRQRERAVLLGTRIGSGAMGVASWSTAVDVGVLNGAGKASLIPAGGGGGEI